MFRHVNQGVTDPLVILLVIMTQTEAGAIQECFILCIQNHPATKIGNTIKPVYHIHHAYRIITSIIKLSTVSKAVQ